MFFFQYAKNIFTYPLQITHSFKYTNNKGFKIFNNYISGGYEHLTIFNIQYGHVIS